MQKIDNCTLEIDAERGVIWVHSPEGYTVLRVSGLPAPIPEVTRPTLLDIGHPPGSKVHVSWRGVKDTTV